MEITRAIGPLCPILMEAMTEQSSRIEEFYSTTEFVVNSTTFGLFTISIQIDDEILTLQELFPTIDAVLRRVKFCNDVGIHGLVRYNK